ncbi:MAG: saccharopine dehydrogenase NADP-binding domain-containing protein [Bacteroidales bacterium]|nr:saccharopine dehydrogenase NADP-binding domain-containing protein [Bacteroidales bacterium]
MKNILILGAGLSTPSLIKYLLDNSTEFGWKVILGDISVQLAEMRIQGHPNGKVIKFDIFNDEQRAEEIKNADIIISMLPARLHYLVVRTCLKFKKDLVTASYVSAEIRNFHEEARENGMIILNEIGLDPGIDHMSAMRIIDNIKNFGGILKAFRSSTGGLVAPRYDNNPWNYKFTWNPRNVVIAGQGGAQFISYGSYKHVPYHKVFTRLQKIFIDGYGEFEVYPNRDSLKYRSEYGIDDIPTMFRGTIRKPGFSKTWNALVQAGVTDDSYIVENSDNLTYNKFINSFLRHKNGKSVEEKFAEYTGLEPDSFDMYKLRWLGLFEAEKIGLKNATPAQILQKRLEEKWKLEPEDKDMIVMQHRFEYEMNGLEHTLVSSMVVEGKDSVHTAMAQTVGLPVAIAAKKILLGEISLTGVHIPTKKMIYEPVLKELEKYGIAFKEQKS